MLMKITLVSFIRSQETSFVCLTKGLIKFLFQTVKPDLQKLSNRVEKIEESRLDVLPQCSVEEGRQLRVSLDQLDADWRQVNDDYNISLRYCINVV